MEQNKNFTNLYEETILALNENGKSPSEVLYVTDDTSYCTWEEFEVQAKQFEYINTLESNPDNDSSVCRFLSIVGEDWWLERSIDCEQEEEPNFWFFATRPSKPGKHGDVYLGKPFNN